MPFKVIRNDITKVKAEIIVNSANPLPRIGSGTDSAIYESAGAEQLLQERLKIGNIDPGNAEYTSAYALQAKYIIHTVGPIWIDGKHNELETLHSCYRNSLAIADKLSAKSIAFPLISTGTYGFPKDKALNIALEEIGKFLLTHETEIILVVFDKSSFEISANLIGSIDNYIEENTVDLITQNEYQPRRRPMVMESADIISEIRPSVDLDTILNDTGETFQQKLFKLIDERKLDDVSVYKKANIDRKVFSSIRCKPNYKPKKKTAVAFAVALELDYNEMTDLLSRAEIALSPSSKFDLIISYCVKNKIYDILEINAILFQYGQPILSE